jgi:carbamoyltransferase
MAVILGINTFHAGSSACLVIDGVPVFAVAEERLNRVKYYGGFPVLAIKACLAFAGLQVSDIDHVAVGRDPRANFPQKALFALTNLGNIANLMTLRKKSRRFLSVKNLLATSLEVREQLLKFRVHNVEHHLAHAASAYFISDWEEAAAFTLDGSGDFATAILARCSGDRIETLKKIYVPHSAGSLYTMISEFIGYPEYGDEGKVMGLAPYGSDRYASTFDDMVSIADGSFRLNSGYFAPFGSNPGISLNEDGTIALHRHYSDEMVKVFGPPRQKHSEVEQRDMDLAFGVQRRFEDIYMAMLNALHRACPSERLALAGGCALNSVANGKLFDHTPFRATCIQPAAGDDGLAMGAALYVSNCVLKEGRRWAMVDAYLGDAFTPEAIKLALDAKGVVYDELPQDGLLRTTVDQIVEGKVIGWFQGRMEWGPRALGNRSILVHPGFPDMKDILNARIKRREWFRPFAPSVLAERQADIFEKTHPSPFMLHVYKIKPEWRERLSAVNHVDDTGRLQTVSQHENPLYWKLIKEFDSQTGIPVLLNTSFNENEPIVHSPAEAIDCFLRTRMDVLVIGPFFCLKGRQTGVAADATG